MNTNTYDNEEIESQANIPSQDETMNENIQMPEQ